MYNRLDWSEYLGQNNTNSTSEHAAMWMDTHGCPCPFEKRLGRAVVCAQSLWSVRMIFLLLFKIFKERKRSQKSNGISNREGWLLLWVDLQEEGHILIVDCQWSRAYLSFGTIKKFDKLDLSVNRSEFESKNYIRIKYESKLDLIR